MRLQKIISKFLFFKNKKRLNILKTIYFNFLFLSPKEAIKFPFFIYGKCHIHNCLAVIKFSAPVKKGMVKIGLSDPVRSYNSKSYLDLRGNITFGNNINLRNGINLLVTTNGNLILEDNVFIADNNTIICYNKIHIKQNTRVGNNTTFMDTDFHFLLNLSDFKINTYISPVIIEENNWIGGFCTIKKGVRTPKGMILVGPYSTLCKDYTKTIPNYSLMGGSPAKLIKEGYRRISNNETEKFLINYFNQNSSPYELKEDVDIDSFCNNK